VSDMKLLLYIPILLICFGAGAQPAPPQQRFNQANELYQQSKYREAAGVYQQLINEGYHERDLYYNAGNAYYKANRTALAVYNYEKALQADPDNVAARHNLELANQRVQGFAEELPLLFFQKWWIQWQHLHKPNGWTIGSVVLLWLLIGGILAALLVSRVNTRIFRVGVTVIGALFVVYLFMSVYAYSAAHSHLTGIVMNSSLKAKAAPDAESKDLFELNEGMKVQILDETETFCKVQLADGKTGWVACAEVKRL
jgi:tetratricopeptide (TPR) repeat protein